MICVFCATGSIHSPDMKNESNTFQLSCVGLLSVSLTTIHQCWHLLPQKTKSAAHKKGSISECEKGKACCCLWLQGADRQTHGTFLIHNLLFPGLVKMSPSKNICSPLYWLHSMLNASIGGQISFNDEPLVSKGPAGAERPPRGNRV